MIYLITGFSGGSDGKESACNAGDLGWIPGSGRSPGERNSNPFQYSCLGNHMDRGAWWTTGIFQIGILEQLAISSSRESSQPRDQTCIPCMSYTGRQIPFRGAIWETLATFNIWKIILDILFALKRKKTRSMCGNDKEAEFSSPTIPTKVKFLLLKYSKRDWKIPLRTAYDRHLQCGSEPNCTDFQTLTCTGNAGGRWGQDLRKCRFWEADLGWC